MRTRWERLEELFHAAVERDPAERGAFLAEVCVSDAELRAEVEALVTAHQVTGDLFDAPASEVAASLIANCDGETLVGQLLDHYEILALLGRGGMGTVYLARDVQLDRKVALKLLPARFTSDERRLYRFIQEAKTASSLNHPNIITIHQVGQAGSAHFIATEFIEGVTLRRRMSGGRIDLVEALDVAVQVASALSAAHAAGIVHRDIKPENIMLRPDGYVKVLDFGLAKLAEKEESAFESTSPPAAETHTYPGLILGTVRYMSPEQARGHPIDAASDIFSLGVTLYEVVAGRPPFEGGSAAEVMAAILKSAPPPLAGFVPETPPELERILARALSKDKERRYRSSDDLLADLRALKEQLEFAAKLDRSSTGAVSSPIRPSPPPFLGRLGWTVLLASILLIAGVWSAVVVFRKPSANGQASLRSVQLYSWKSERGDGALRARFSPDGGRFAYATVSGEWLGIWVKPALSGVDPVLLTKDETDNHWPVWSPDGRQVAFVSRRGNTTGVWSTAVAGGTPNLLGTVNEPSPELLRFSHDGRTLYYQSRSNLYVLDQSTKTTRRLTNFDPSKLPAKSFSISPGEDRIAYTDAGDEGVDVWVASTSGADPVRLTNDPEDDMYPVWHPDGRRVVYTSTRAGTNELCVAYLDGRPPTQITSGSADSRRATDIAADGTRILQVSTRNDADVYRVEVHTGRESAIGHEVGLNLWPELSPDGTILAFQYAGTPAMLVRSSIVTRPALSAGKQKQIVSDGFGASWSPDGSSLAFLRFSRNETNLFTVPAGGGEARKLTTGGVQIRGFGMLPGNRFAGDIQWSPDGRRIAYCSSKSGRAAIWSIDTDGHNDVEIASDAGGGSSFYGPLWSPDGSQIAFAAETRATPGGGNAVWSLRLAGRGGPRTILQGHVPVRLIHWLPSGQSLLAALDEDQTGYMNYPIRVAVVETTVRGESRPITSLESTYLPSVQVSPDWRNIAFISNQDGADNLWLIAATGGKARRITANTDPRLYLTSPAWSPDGSAVYFSKQSRSNWISTLEPFK